MVKVDYIRESIDFLHYYIMKSLQKRAEENGVTLPQARVIADVIAHKTVSVKQLSQNLKMTQSTVSDIVERLTSKGILVKTPNAKDKRLVDISLTEGLAEEIKGSIPEIASQSLIGALSLLNDEEQQTVEKGIELLVSAVKEKMEGESMDHCEFTDVIYFPGETNKRNR